jgi:hypothetical protein
MTQGMRRGLTSYGDVGFSLFLRKAFIKAMGLSDDALSRPIVGIANTFSDYNACHGNVPKLVEAVKRGVMLAGAAPGPDRGYAALFHRSVLQADEGCDFDFLVPGRSLRE